MLLSLVLPTYQQAHRMRHSIAGIRRLRALLPYPAEVLVADQGSDDGTPEIAQEAGFRVLRLGGVGRGEAVRAGMLSAAGVYRLLVEGDWSVPPEQLQMLLPPALTGFDVAVASRQAPGSTRANEPLSSYAVRRAYGRAVQSLVLPDLADAQLGYQCFRAEAARALFSRSREEGDAVQAEVLALARQFGLEVAEVPIDWTFNPLLRLHPLLDGPAMLAALLRIRARLAAGRYAPLQMAPPADPEPQGWFI